VPQADRTAVDVQAVEREGLLAVAGQHLGRERLVELDQVEVVGAAPRELAQLRDRGHRPDAHDLGRDAGLGRLTEDRERLETQRLGALLAHQQQGRRAVGDARRRR
jgi:hypothetical protein